ncbi:serine/threonine protein kinase [Kineosporia rhizophila]|uniref:serine/threonine-protein kinase n=1 Tax=Kineosporia rhizophila TaxID=84633 RepID=UPI001E33F00E|nr:serine/threonine-protein kinase [Kineosporia rhizophila]MCE0540070.1 serine/threonine protein kinase [Kineosporia rhizophila]
MPDASRLRAGDPTEVAGYRIVSRLGQGGQGVVFLGAGPDGSRVAVKQLRLEDERSRQQFAKEVSAARRVAAFCTARVIDFDLEAESPYVVSEFIEGPSLQRLVRDSGPITGSRLQRLAIGTATALAAIHQAGVVHRDFKPANVMISPEGPRVIDFGIARDLSHETTVTSRIFGTPAYMAPEQIRAERVSPQTDMFAWASVVAFAATGRAPFEAEHMMAVVHRITTMEPRLDGVPAGLAEVLRRCLAKEPDQRPTAQQALALLLGRPEHDQADPTVVLAEGSRLAQNSGGAGGESAAEQAEQALRTPTTRRVSPAPVRTGESRSGLTAWSSPEHSPEYGTPETPPSGLPATRTRPSGVLSSIGAVLAVLVIGGGMVGGGALLLRTLLDNDEPRTNSSSPTDPNTGTDPGTDEADPEPTGADETIGATDVPLPQTSTDTPAALPDWTAGSWRGEVYQPLGEVSRYEVVLTLEAGRSQGRIDIRSLGCGGVLSFESGTDSVVMATQLEDDLWDTCADDSTVRLTRSGDGEMLFSWQDAAEESNSGGGTLRLE